MATEYYLPKDVFDSIYAQVPRLTVEVIICTKDGVLLTKRSMEPHIGTWHIPGGTVRFGEALTDAVKRVARNELGVEVEPGKLLSYIEYPGLHAEGYKGWPVGIAIAATIVNGTPSASDQGEEVGFFNELPEPTFPDIKPFLQSVLDAR